EVLGVGIAGHEKTSESRCSGGPGHAARCKLVDVPARVQSPCRADPPTLAKCAHIWACKQNHLHFARKLWRIRAGRAVGPSARGSAMRRGETGAMGERLAGATMRDWRRNGLIARLAALEGHFGAGAAGNGREPWPAQRLPLLPFALGLSTSLLVGAAA